MQTVYQLKNFFFAQARETEGTDISSLYLRLAEYTESNAKMLNVMGNLNPSTLQSMLMGNLNLEFESQNYPEAVINEAASLMQKAIKELQKNQ